MPGAVAVCNVKYVVPSSDAWIATEPAFHVAGDWLASTSWIDTSR